MEPLVKIEDRLDWTDFYPTTLGDSLIEDTWDFDTFEKAEKFLINNIPSLVKFVIGSLPNLIPTRGCSAISFDGAVLKYDIQPLADSRLTPQQASNIITSNILHECFHRRYTHPCIEKKYIELGKFDLKLNKFGNPTIGIVTGKQIGRAHV